MALTILIKFWGLQYIRSPIIRNYQLFKEKSLKLEKQFLIFCQSAQIAPKPNDQCRSYSISRVPLQISSARFFSVFELPPKLRVVHIKKKFKISIFSKMAITILFKFCGFIVYWKPKNITISAFPEKILETRKIVFNSVSHVTQRLNQLTILLQIRYLESPCKYFLPFFRSTLKMKGSSHQEKIKKFCFLKNCFNDFHKMLWIYSTVEPQQYDTIGYLWKILQTKKKKKFYPSPSLATKPTD